MPDDRQTLLGERPGNLRQPPPRTPELRDRAIREQRERKAAEAAAMEEIANRGKEESK